MKVILDLDTGIDDGMALAYAVGSPELDLIGITGTYGNVYTEEGVQNALNLLHILGRDDIPVYAGARHALNKNGFQRLEASSRIHGENGTGQVELETSPRRPEILDGIDFLIQSVKKYGKDLIIITTGPMTNLASALLKAPEIKELLGKVIVMGGALTVPGNVSPYAEANVLQDPDAAKFLFTSDIDITMVGLDVTRRSQLTNSDTQKWRDCGSTAGKIYADMVDYYISKNRPTNGLSCYLHDPSAAICAVHPEYFNMISMHITVVTEGEAAGRTTGDLSKLKTPEPSTKICVGVDSSRLENHLNEIFIKLFQKISKAK